MSEIIEGELNGKIVSFKWSSFEKKGGKNIPLLTFTAEATHKGELVKLFASLFFSNDYKTFGFDKGREEIVCSLECLESYGVKVDPTDPGSADPTTFGPQMIGKTVSLFCQKNKEGKQAAYINSAKSMSLEDDAVKNLWSGITGTPPVVSKTQPPPKATTPVDDDEDDDLPF